MLDVFGGVGGLTLGFHRAGFHVVASVELDPVNVATYSANFPGIPTISRDVSKLSGDEVRSLAGLSKSEDIDVVCGGPPCQGFSLIGKRQHDDPRNRLLVEFARLITELRPRYFIIENVSGLVSGRTRTLLATALRVLRAAGYGWVTPIQVLNAKDFGVPQTRKRVIILGYRKGETRPVYPRKRSRIITVHDAIGDLYPIGTQKSPSPDGSFLGRLGSPSPYSRMLRLRGRSSVLTGCQLCSHAPDVIRRFQATQPGTQEPISRFQRLHPNRPAPTLRAGTGREKGSFTAARPIHPTQPRCITVREAARLQSFPDSFQFHPTQWHGFRQVGNSVPPLMAIAIASSLMRTVSNGENKCRNRTNKN